MTGADHSAEIHQGAVSATHLLATNHEGGTIDDYTGRTGPCYFCGHVGRGMPAADVISDEYFSDHDLRAAPNSDTVCSYCAYCMDHRDVKQGHWIAWTDGIRLVSTGDLLPAFRDIQSGGLDPPIAVHVSKDPIRSEHAYLWTPTGHSTAPLRLTYGRQELLLDWAEFDGLLAAIEELRWHGFRGDDIRSGEPRVRDVQSVGRDRYRTLDDRIDHRRGTAAFEVAWTVSGSRDDQPNPPKSET